MHIIQTPLFDCDAFVAKKDNDRLLTVLEALPAEGLLVMLAAAVGMARRHRLKELRVLMT